MVPELTVTDFAASLDFYQRILGFGYLLRFSQYIDHKQD